MPPLKSRVTDDPQVVAEQLANDYSNHVVPVSARIGRWQLTMSFWSLISAMVWLFYGALVASLYGSVNAVIAIVLSVLTYSIMGRLFTRWGIRSGLNSTMLTRRMFGTAGAFLTAILIAANTTYYAVFESSTLAVAFHYYTPDWDIRIWYAIIVIAMLPLMLGGVQTWMARVNGLLLPFYGVGLIAVLIITAINYPGSDWLSFDGIVPVEGRAYPGWLLGFVLYMGIWLLMPTTQDFARFGRIEDERFHSRVSFGPVFYFVLFLVNGLAGIFLVRAVIPTEPAAETGVVLAILGASGVLGLILIVISQTRINTLNYYQASTNWDRIWTGLTGRRVHRGVWVVFVAVLVFLMMLTDVFAYLQKALTWQGVFLVSWVAIALTHYAMVSRDRNHGPEFRAQRLPVVTWGLGVWVVSAGAGIFVAEVPGVPVALSAIPAIVALVTATVLYALVLTLAPTRVDASKPDPRTEVDDPERHWIECHICDRSYVTIEMDRDVHADLAPICDACATGRRTASTTAQ
ncbi:purine-cytosine permease family protein [Arthrobacter sp. NPDC055138]